MNPRKTCEKCEWRLGADCLRYPRIQDGRCGGREEYLPQCGEFKMAYNYTIEPKEGKSEPIPETSV